MAEKDTAIGDDQLKADLAAIEAEKPETPEEEEKPSESESIPAKTDTEEEDTEVEDQPKKPEAPAKEETVEEEDVENLEIPVRVSQSHIIARLRKQNEKLRSKINDGVEDADEAPTKDEGEADEDVLTPEVADAIEKRIQRKIAPILDSNADKSDEEELQGLFRDEPESKRYEKRIRAFMKDPAYLAVPPAMIFHDLAFSEAQTQGAKKKQVANAEAEHTRSAGTSRRPTTTKKGGFPTEDEINSMSDEDFEKLSNEVRSGKYVS